MTLIPEDETVTHPIMAWEKLTEARLEEVLTAYKADIPLGMIREENDFRISVAGAQEKTALLRIGNDWCIPKGITPTTHIIKLPIGEIRQPNATLDLSQSVDNEYYCLLLAKELGLNVPDAEIIKAGNVRALAVERFDRRWNAERTVLLRLPQEDMCQTFGLPSSVKYESDGGPGIARIMAFLMGSSEALKDRSVVDWRNGRSCKKLLRIYSGWRQLSTHAILRHHFSISGPWRYGNTHQRSQTGNGA